ncbi:hypothetical protein OFEAOIEE_LOCUS3713 [Methylorubrum extorquens]
MKRTILALTGTLALAGAAVAADDSTSLGSPSKSTGHEMKNDTSGSTGSVRAGSSGASGGPSTGVPGSAVDKPTGSDATGSGAMGGSDGTGSSR